MRTVLVVVVLLALMEISDAASIDLIVLVDTSKSAAELIANLGTKAESKAMFTDPQNTGTDLYQCAVTAHTDFPFLPHGDKEDTAFRVVQSWTTCPEAYKEIQKLEAKGGWDAEEAGIEALYQVITGEGLDLNGDGPSYGDIEKNLLPKTTSGSTIIYYFSPDRDQVLTPPPERKDYPYPGVQNKPRTLQELQTAVKNKGATFVILYDQYKNANGRVLPVQERDAKLQSSDDSASLSLLDIAEETGGGGFLVSEEAGGLGQALKSRRLKNYMRKVEGQPPLDVGQHVLQHLVKTQVRLRSISKVGTVVATLGDAEAQLVNASNPTTSEVFEVVEVAGVTAGVRFKQGSGYLHRTSTGVVSVASDVGDASIWVLEEVVDRTGLDRWKLKDSTSAQVLGSSTEGNQITMTEDSPPRTEWVLEPVTPPTVQNGLNAYFYKEDHWGIEGPFPEFPDFASLTPKKTRVDLTVNYPESVANAAWPGLPFTDYFASRHVGLLKVDEAGLYKLYLTSDDGARLFVDGKLVIDNGGIHIPTEKSATLQLEAGQHPIVLEHFEAAGGAVLVFEWERPGQPREIVPAHHLVSMLEPVTPPTPPPTPPPTSAPASDCRPDQMKIDLGPGGFVCVP